MKRTILLYTLLLLALFTSCYEDHSAVATTLIPDITIADFKEGGYTIISYADNYLDLTADVTTDYPESELSYKWYLIDRSAVLASGDDNPYEREYIASGKQLHYNIRLIPGEYEVVLEVTASNGYSVTRKTSLFVTTEFSEGFYILKETTDGHTELDLCNPEADLYMQDVLTAVHGQPMQGAPEAISTTICQGYIDSDTNMPSSATIVTVTTKEREISVMRTTDLKEVMNAQSLLFTRFADDEIPYRIVQCMWCNILMTNKGIRSQYQATLEKSSSGKFGITNGITTGRDAAYDAVSQYLFLWDPEARNVVACDYNGTARSGSKEDNNLSNLTTYDCLHIGYSYAGEKVVYVLRQRSGMTWVMAIASSRSSGWKMESLTPLKAYAPHVNQSSTFSVCATEATLVYGIAEGKLWGYDFANNTERELSVAGLTEGETLTYISDQYTGGGLSNYFIIGTEQGDEYTLRFYNNFGGQPDGQPVYTVRGKGHVRGVRFTTNDSSQSYAQGALMD